MKYVIAGFGKFGRIALRRLLETFEEPSIVIVEMGNVPRPPDLPADGAWIQGDAVSFLLKSGDLLPDDVIIPMVPYHLLAAYVQARHPHCREILLPEALETRLPNPFRVDPSNLCCSRADFMCPDDCPEGDCCTVTGEPRDPLYAAIESLNVPGFTVLVQRSFQILPGVGGYPMGSLMQRAKEISQGRYLIATSCKCHAILTAMAA